MQNLDQGARENPYDLSVPVPVADKYVGVIVKCLRFREFEITENSNDGVLLSERRIQRRGGNQCC